MRYHRFLPRATLVNFFFVFASGTKAEHTRGYKTHTFVARQSSKIIQTFYTPAKRVYEEAWKRISIIKTYFLQLLKKAINFQRKNIYMRHDIPPIYHPQNS